MIRPPSLRLLAPVSAALVLTAAPERAFAQAPPLNESLVVGGWTFRPTLELRLRGEYRSNVVEGGSLGGLVSPTPVLYDPPAGSDNWLKALSAPLAEDFVQIGERARLGLAVDRGPVTAAVVLQDARALADGPFTPLTGLAPLSRPLFSPYEAYIDVHSRSGRKVFLRLGRQAVTWGDGRLVGANDFSPTGRSLDAARFGVQIGDVDVELMAAMLAAPGRGSRYGEGGIPSAGSAGALGGLGGASTGSLGSSNLREGAGAQLYGLDATWHFIPLLNVELTGLARITRDPTPVWLTPSDTYTIDGRLFGDRRGFQYAIEGAYQLGRVASFGVNRSQSAFALAARASLETALPWHLTFGADGVYASGDDGSLSGTQTRFDPILPDEYQSFGRMNLYAWSNILAAGGSIRARPLESLELTGAYHYAGLASATGRWITGALVPVGWSPDNTSTSLGHEIDATLKLSPWKPVTFQAGYSLFLFGDGAQAILTEVGRPATVQHWAYLQAIVRAP